MPAAKPKTRELLLERNGRPDLRITIPEDWKITFAPVNPSQGYGDNALRLYETKDKQRAVFTNIVSFRDLSIPVQQRLVETKDKSKGERDSKGNLKAESSREVNESWEAVE